MPWRRPDLEIAIVLGREEIIASQALREIWVRSGTLLILRPGESNWGRSFHLIECTSECLHKVADIRISHCFEVWSEPWRDCEGVESRLLREDVERISDLYEG